MEMNNTTPKTYKSEYSDSKYMAVGLVMLIITFIVYRPRYFINKEDLFLDITLVVLVALVSIKTGIFIKNNKRLCSGSLDLYEMSVIPMFCHMIIVLSDECRHCVKGFIIAAAIGIIYIALLLWVNAARGKSKKRYSLKRSIAEGFYRVRAGFLAVLIVQILYMSAVSFGFGIETKLDVPGEVEVSEDMEGLQSWDESRTLLAHFDTLRVLKYEDQFAITSVDDRFQIFKDIVDVELNYLSVPYLVKVEARDLADKTVASYSSDSKVIYVDPEFLMEATAAELIRAAAHESRHSWQHCVVELWEELKASDDRTSQANLILLSDFLADADDYRECFLHYQSDGQAYYEQCVEEDAREYADKAYVDFMNRITEIENEKGLSIME